MDGNKKDIKVKTGLSLEYAQRILVTDIDCKDSLLDLIDNSIDSARQAILNGGGEVDARGMPEDYNGYEINLGVDNGSIYIEDTCSGIEPGAIQDRLLVIGEESNEPLAIGHFGVGLKRALLKLAKTYTIETSYAGATYSIECTAEDLTDSSKAVVAKYIDNKEPSSYTQIRLSDISEEAKREILRSSTWEHTLSREIGIRYSIFIKKGLVIKYKNIPIKDYCPGLRNYKSIQIQEDNIGDVPHGISVNIRAGLHERYRFKDEGPENPVKENEKITGEFGWYYVCNDRVIKIACIDKKFGWASKWHPEYYGFVGWVYFTGNVKDLPWNTKKTDIDPSSDVFSAIKGHLKKYATKYRTQNRTLRKNKESETTKEDHDDIRQIDLLGGRNEPDQGLNVKIEKDSSSDTPMLNKSEEKDSPPDQEKEKSSHTSRADTYDKSKPKTKIEHSAAVSEKLQELGSQKLSQLYSSLCVVSLVEHPVLMSVGAWSFFETLAKLSGSKGDVAFTAYFNSKINEWYSDNKNQRTLFKKVLGDIAGEGNLDKHESHYFTVDARPLAMRFTAVEPLILRILNEIISKRSILLE